MKSLRHLLVSALILAGLGALVALGTPVVSWAQSSVATRVQQDSQILQAATAVGTSVTSASTITITPPAGQFVYVQEVDVANCAGGTAVTAAAPTTITTTNLTGSPAFTVGSGVTAGLCQPFPTVVYPNGLKSSSPGTNVTFVLPTFATNQTVRVNVAYSFGF